MNISSCSEVIEPVIQPAAVTASSMDNMQSSGQPEDGPRILLVPNDNPREIRCTMTLASFFTFKASETYIQKLESVMSDHNIYLNSWDLFVDYCINDWKRCIYACVVLLFFTFYFAFPTLPTIACTSAGFSLLSITTSFVLLHTTANYMARVNRTPSQVSAYLKSIMSQYFGFQMQAFIFSIPKASFIYAFLIFLSHWVVLLSK